jgi:hypothetical protein
MSKFQTNNRRAIFSPLKDYCTFALDDPDAYIEVTEWSNKEGYDININTKNRDISFGITWGEFKLLKKLIKEFDV